VLAGFLVVHTEAADGQRFTIPDEMRDAYFDGLAYGNGRLVALGDDGRAIISDDRGETFAWPGNAPLESFELLFRRGEFIAVGRDLDSTWEAPRGAVAASADGVEWQLMSAGIDGGYLGAFDASETAIVAVGGGDLEGTLHRYTDAGGWQQVSPTGGPKYEDVLYDNGAFLAIASNDPATSRGALARSTDDGQTFVLTETEPGLMSLTHDAGRYLASGAKRIAISDDAVNWSVTTIEAPSDRPETINDWYFYKVAHDGCAYRAVGGIDGWMARSNDGIVWTDELGPSHGNLLEVIALPDR
jgi:hypothetical protein